VSTENAVPTGLLYPPPTAFCPASQFAVNDPCPSAESANGAV
jgi:hypothetical protein